MEDLIVVGNGMAGVACLEQILKHSPKFRVTVFGDETHANYNRILLSSVLAGERSADDIMINPLDWYQQNHVALRLGVRIVDVEPEAPHHQGRRRQRHPLRQAAAGHRHPPPGFRRSTASTRKTSSPSAISTTPAACVHAAGKGVRAVVIGGGLLGLEAARGLQLQGCDVTVVHLMDTLMNMQLDATGRRLPRPQDGADGRARAHLAQDRAPAGQRARAGRGLRRRRRGARRNRGHRRRHPPQRRTRPQGRPHRESRHRGQRPHGNLATRASSPWASAWSTTARSTDSSRRSSNRAKCSPPPSPATEDPSSRDGSPPPNSRSWAWTSSRPATSPRPKAPKSCATKIPPWASTRSCSCATTAWPAWSWWAMRPTATATWTGCATTPISPCAAAICCSPSPSRDRGESVAEMADSVTVCGCIGVSKGAIIQAIHQKGVRTLAQLKESTRASTGCGSCSGTCQQILKAVAPDFEEETKKVLCKCVPFTQENLREIILTQRLKSVQQVLDIYGNGEGCEICKPALSYLVDVVWCGDHQEDRSARFINDRVHANIQNDGTFSVVPRIRGGVTTPAELRTHRRRRRKVQGPHGEDHRLASASTCWACRRATCRKSGPISACRPARRTPRAFAW